MPQSCPPGRAADLPMLLLLVPALATLPLGQAMGLANRPFEQSAARREAALCHTLGTYALSSRGSEFSSRPALTGRPGLEARAPTSAPPPAPAPASTSAPAAPALCHLLQRSRSNAPPLLTDSRRAKLGWLSFLMSRRRGVVGTRRSPRPCVQLVQVSFPHHYLRVIGFSG